MKNISKILFLAFTLTLFGCNQDDYTSYSDTARLYFYYENYLGKEEPEIIPTRHTFVYMSDGEYNDTIWIKVKTMGFPSDKDRYFEIQAEKNLYDVTTYFSVTEDEKENIKFAEENVHFKSFNNSDVKKLLIVKAGEVYAEFPLILNRDASLKTDYHYITLKIKDNNEFKGGVTEKNRIVISLIDKPIKPKSWIYIEPQFGTYSDTKLMFIINNSDLKLTDDYIIDATIAEKLAFQRYFTTLVNNYNKDKDKSEWMADENGYLIDFNDKGTPVLRPTI